MLESKLRKVEAVNKGIDEPDGVFLFNILVDCVWEENCLVSVGSRYMLAHGFLVDMKLALSLTVSD